MVYTRCFFLIRIHTGELLSLLPVTAIIPLAVSHLPSADLQIYQGKTTPVWREATKIFWKNAVSQFIKLVVDVVTGKRKSAFFSKHFQSPTAGVQTRRLPPDLQSYCYCLITAIWSCGNTGHYSSYLEVETGWLRCKAESCGVWLRDSEYSVLSTNYPIGRRISFVSIFFPSFMDVSFPYSRRLIIFATEFFDVFGVQSLLL